MNCMRVAWVVVLSTLAATGSMAAGWVASTAADPMNDEPVSGVMTTADDGHSVALTRRALGPVYLVVSPPKGSAGPARASSFRPAWRVDNLQAHTLATEGELRRLRLEGLQQVIAGSLYVQLWSGARTSPEDLAEVLNGSTLRVRYGTLADRPALVEVPLSGVRETAITTLRLNENLHEGFEAFAAGWATSRKRSKECESLAVRVDFSTCISRMPECASAYPDAADERRACLTAR